MKLPISFLEKKEASLYYLALILRNEKVNAIIMEGVDRNLRIVSQFEEPFSDSIENATLEELLNVFDKAISKAEEALPNNVETQKTIFGLKASWIEDNKIKKEYLDKLKRASSELGLTPIGFIILNEALIKFIEKEEGAPITAILAEIGKKYVTVSWIKAGKILEAKNSLIHESAAYTVDSLLKHFESPEIMPSRIILFDSNEELAQELTGHQWSKSLPFLHLPQIETLSLNFDANAMLLGVSAQLGLNAIAGFKKKMEEEIPELHSQDFIEKVKEETTQEPQKEEILTEEIVEESKGDTIEQLDENVSLEFFGFLEGKDIAKTTPQTKMTEKATEELENIPQKIVEEKIELIPDDILLSEEKEELPGKTVMILPKIKETLFSIFKTFKKLPLNKLFALIPTSGGKNKLIVIPIVLVVLVILLFMVLGFFAKATVTLGVKPDISEKTQSVTFSTTAGTDVKNNVIAAEFVSVSEDGTDTTPATGKKSVGNKAKGTVTVFNNDTSPVTLSSGTKITSSNGLIFTLDSGVNVASASGDPFSGTKPATANVNVTSDTFGTEYNLPSGTKFSLSGNSAVAAKNDNPFSGGTKKDITVVSKDDTAKLLESLPKKLEDKAKNDLSQKVSSDKAVLPNFASETFDKKTFDKNVGDEANQLTLTGTVSFEGISYKKDDLVALANNLFDANDITINKDNLNITVKDIKTKEKEADANLQIQALLLPKIDNAALTKQIAVQSVSKATASLSSLSRVSSVTISISPSIPFLPKSLPGNSNNIKIVIKLNG